MAQLNIKPDFNTSVPNYIYDPLLWRHEGRKGISAHYVLIYLLLIDKVTEVHDNDDGTKTGVVLGGTPVSFRDIATALGCSYSTVQRATAHLVKVGLIRRHEVSRTDGYRWEVLNCRKLMTGKQADGSINMGGKNYKKKEHSINPEGEDNQRRDGNSTSSPEPPAPPKRFVCGYCNAVGDSAPALLKHQIETHNEFDCVYCDCIFGQKEVLTDHLVNEHGWAFASGLCRPPKPE